jgi:hypothetical protein
MHAQLRRTSTRRVTFLVAFSCAAAIGAPQASAGRAQQDLTGTSPPGAAASGVELEPQVAAVPGDPRRIAVGWDQQLLDGTWEVVVALSSDGGVNWTQSVVPGLTSCAPPAGIASAAAALPSLSYGADRRLYLSALCYVPRTTVNEQLVTTLAPGATSWAPPSDLGSGTRGRVIADAKVAGSAYVAYLSGAADTEHSVLVRHTTDGGRTWLPAATAYASQGDDAYTADIAITGHAPHSGPAQLLVALHGGLDPNPQGTYTLAVRSTDSGADWTAAERIPDDMTDAVDQWPSDPEPSLDPTAGAQPYGSTGPPIRVVSGADGTAFVIWSQLNGDGTTQLLVSHSRTIGGWTTPVTINSSPHRAFEPQAVVTSNGTLVVTYYDDRHDQTGVDDAWTVDLWQATSRDAGSTWQESHTAGPFDIRPAVQQSLFTDYFGIASAGDDLVTAYVATAGLSGSPGATEGLTDVYVSRNSL